MDDIRLQELEARALDLEQQLAGLRLAIEEARVVGASPATVHEIPGDPASVTDGVASPVTEVVDRRSLLRRSGAVAAGAIAGGAAIAAATATPAAAANGDNMVVGAVNTATALTTLTGRLAINNSNSSYTLRSVANASGGDAVVAQALGTDGIGVLASSTDGPGLVVTNGTQVIPPQAGDWPYGSFLIAGSHLFFCLVGGPGPQTKWARLSGVFVPFDGPIRVYDSRPGTQPVTPGKSRFVDHEERTLSLTVNNAVPAANAPSAVVLNLTATNTNPGGFFTAWRSTVPWPGTSSVNWGSANSTIANQSTVKINGLPQIKVRCEGAGGADLVVDVVGYYL